MSATGKMSLREKAILGSLAVLFLYAFAVVLWFVNCSAAWDRSRKLYEKACATYQTECELIGEKSRWDEAYEEAKAQMPLFEAGKATDTTWLQKMDVLAEKHHISIAQRQGLKEVEVGEVLELPIDVRNWEGALESLVRFMHELENTSDGMFDIRSISFRPSNKKGYLKGQFVLTCAYMRE